MTPFDADTLRLLDEAHEVGIRTDRHPGTTVVIWVVVAEDAVFVRSFRGTKGRWYRDLAAGGPAMLDVAAGGWRCRRRPWPIRKPSSRRAVRSSENMRRGPMLRR